MNRRRSGKTCSPTRILVAMTLLMLLAAVALTMSSGVVKLQVADASDRTPTAFVASAHAPSQSPKQILATYSHLPLMFEPNQGQIDAGVKFAARGSGYGLYLTAQEAVSGPAACGIRRPASGRSNFRSEHAAGRSKFRR